jgi:hypothetical protein
MVEFRSTKKYFFAEVYKRLPGESLNNIYTSLNDADRTKSVNPNVYFYRASNYQYPGFIY